MPTFLRASSLFLRAANLKFFLVIFLLQKTELEWSNTDNVLKRAETPAARMTEYALLKYITQ